MVMDTNSTYPGKHHGCVLAVTPATGLFSDLLSKQSKILAPPEHSKAKCGSRKFQVTKKK
jgi:hypothetical protein